MTPLWQTFSVTSFMPLIEAALSRWHPALPADCAPRFSRYFAELAAWNRAYNLTAITEPAAQVDKHLLDCLAALPWVQSERTVDVGAGAGFPGLLWKLAKPDLELVLVESAGKKCRFLRHVVRTLELRGVEVREGRAEAVASADFMQYTARAVASIELLATWFKAYAQQGRGRALLLRGEVESAELSRLPEGVRLAEVAPLGVPAQLGTRNLVVLELG